MSKRRDKSSSRSHDDKERHGEQAQVSTDFCGSTDRGSGKAALRRGHPGGQRPGPDGDHRHRQPRRPRVRLVVAAEGLPVPRRSGGQQGEARSVDDAGAPDLQARGRRRLSPHPRPQGHRRGAHRDARLTGTASRWWTRSPPARTSTSRSPPRTTIPRINAMLDAYKKGKQVVQVGTHQRSWDHFIEAKKMLDSGALGNVTQVVITAAGLLRAAEGGRGAGAGRARLGHVAGSARRRSRSSRAGSASAPGTTTAAAWSRDWGAHHVDVAQLVHERRRARRRSRRWRTAHSSPCRTPIPRWCPDTFSISWQYDNFLMTFANGEALHRRTRSRTGACSSSATAASLQVNRQGYAVRPVVAPVRNKVGPPPPPTAGGVTLGAGGAGDRAREARAAGAAAARRRRGGGNMRSGRSRSCTSTRAAASKRTTRSTCTRATSSTASSRGRSRTRRWRSATTRRCRACSRSSRCRRASRSAGTRRRGRARRSRPVASRQQSRQEPCRDMALHGLRDSICVTGTADAQ